MGKCSKNLLLLLFIRIETALQELFLHVALIKKKGINIMAIVSYTKEEIKKMSSQTDWNLLRNMQDEDIDYSDIPETSDEMFTHAVRGNIDVEMPVKVTILISPTLLNGFRRRTGKDWRSHLSGNVETWLRQQTM